MKLWGIASAILVGGLSSLQFAAPTLAGPSAVKPAPATFSEYEFPDGPAAYRPTGGVIIDQHGMLYGTLSQGGTTRPKAPPWGGGAIFRLVPPSTPNAPWTETQVFVFPQNRNGDYVDGFRPQDLTYSGLEAAIPYDGAAPLFGFAPGGGVTYDEPGGSRHAGNGTVFMFNPPGSSLAAQCKFVLLHSFSSDFDGFTPSALTVGPDGAVYGTTTSHGSTTDMSGVVFRLEPTDPDHLCDRWSYRRIYEFDRNGSFGEGPTSLVFGPDGYLYVAVSSLGPSGGGVIQLRPRLNHAKPWVPAVAYQVTDTQFGTAPSHLIFGADGNLYAGSGGGGAHGQGTVFRLVPRRNSRVPWTPQVVYALGDNPNDGSGVDSHLAFGPGGALYSTTQSGGAGNVGTTFKLTPPRGVARRLPWIETKLYDFSGTDGGYPQGTLAFGADGTLYGTTVNGDPAYPSTFVNGYAYAIAP